MVQITEMVNFNLYGLSREEEKQLVDKIPLPILIEKSDINPSSLFQRAFRDEDRQALIKLNETPANQRLLRTAKLLSSFSLASNNGQDHRYLLELSLHLQIFSQDILDGDMGKLDTFYSNENDIYRTGRGVHYYVIPLSPEQTFLCADFFRLRQLDSALLTDLCASVWSRYTIQDFTPHVHNYLFSKPFERHLFIGLCRAVNKQTNQLNRWVIEISNEETLHALCENLKGKSFVQLTIHFRKTSFSSATWQQFGEFFASQGGLQTKIEM